jgi:hypothetical protein
MFILLAALAGTVVVLVVFRKRVKSGLSKLRTKIRSPKRTETKALSPKPAPTRDAWLSEAPAS